MGSGCFDILPSKRAAYYPAKYVEFIEKNLEHSSYPEWTYDKTELLLGWVIELASEKTLLDVMEALVEPDILLWNVFLPAKARASGYLGGTNVAWRGTHPGSDTGFELPPSPYFPPTT